MPVIHPLERSPRLPRFFMDTLPLTSTAGGGHCGLKDHDDRGALQHHLGGGFEDERPLVVVVWTEFCPFTLTRSDYMPRQHNSSAPMLEKQVYSADFVEPDGEGDSDRARHPALSTLFANLSAIQG